MIITLDLKISYQISWNNHFTNTYEAYLELTPADDRYYPSYCTGRTVNEIELGTDDAPNKKFLTIEAAIAYYFPIKGAEIIADANSVHTGVDVFVLGSVITVTNSVKDYVVATLSTKVDKTVTVNGRPLSGNVTLTKSDLSLGNVDNTSDANKPVSTATQTELDKKSKAYEGATLRNNAFPIFKSVTVGSGVAVFHLTNDGTSSGTALFPNGVIQDSVNAFVSDSAASYQMAYAFSNGNKTVTVTTNKLTTSNILTGILGQAAGNGSVVKLSVWGY